MADEVALVSPQGFLWTLLTLRPCSHDSSVHQLTQPHFMTSSIWL